MPRGDLSPVARRAILLNEWYGILKATNRACAEMGNEINSARHADAITVEERLALLELSGDVAMSIARLQDTIASLEAMRTTNAALTSRGCKAVGFFGLDGPGS